MRPGPRRPWAISKPRPSPSRMLLGGYAHVLEHHLAVPVRRVVVPEDRKKALHRDARGVHRHQDHALLGVDGVVGVRPTHHDHDLAAGVHDAAGPPLRAVDDVGVAVPPDLRLDVGGVRRRYGRLGHCERRADLAAQQRVEPLLLLVLAAVALDGLHVAGVGRGAVEDLRREADPAHHLAQGGVLEIREAGSAVAVGQEQIPEPRLPGLRLQLLHQGRRLPAIGERFVLGVVGLLVGIDVLVHELAQAGEGELGLLVVGELHGGILASGREVRRVAARRPVKVFGGAVVEGCVAIREASDESPDEALDATGGG